MYMMVEPLSSAWTTWLSKTCERGVVVSPGPTRSDEVEEREGAAPCRRGFAVQSVGVQWVSTSSRWSHERRRHPPFCCCSARARRRRSGFGGRQLVEERRQRAPHRQPSPTQKAAIERRSPQYVANAVRHARELHLAATAARRNASPLVDLASHSAASTASTAAAKSWPTQSGLAHRRSPSPRSSRSSSPALYLPVWTRNLRNPSAATAGPTSWNESSPTCRQSESVKSREERARGTRGTHHADLRVLQPVRGERVERELEERVRGLADCKDASRRQWDAQLRERERETHRFLPRSRPLPRAPK